MIQNVLVVPPHATISHFIKMELALHLLASTHPLSIPLQPGWGFLPQSLRYHISWLSP